MAAAISVATCVDRLVLVNPVRGHCPSAIPGNSEVIVFQTSRLHGASPCRIAQSASKPSNQPRLASAWNVLSLSLRVPALVSLAPDAPVSSLLACWPPDDSRPTRLHVVLLKAFQVALLIDSCCPRRSAETRWEHGVHRTPLHFCLSQMSFRPPNAHFCSTRQSQNNLQCLSPEPTHLDT